jgi:hypothetical protein
LCRIPGGGTDKRSAAATDGSEESEYDYDDGSDYDESNYDAETSTTQFAELLKFLSDANSAGIIVSYRVSGSILTSCHALVHCPSSG